MNESSWSARWNPSNSIKELFNRLKEYYVIAIISLQPYTMEQMIDKGHIAIQCTGLYKLVILELNGFDPTNKTWPNFKAHFREAYDTHLRSGPSTANTNGYHGTANAVDVADDNSLSLMHGSFSIIQVANNANF